MASQTDSVGPHTDSEDLKLEETPVEAVAEVSQRYFSIRMFHVKGVRIYVRITYIIMYCMLQVVTSVRSSWQDLRSIPIGYRAAQLRSLRKMIEDNIAKFEEAVQKDLRKVGVKIIFFITLSVWQVGGSDIVVVGGKD